MIRTPKKKINLLTQQQVVGGRNLPLLFKKIQIMKTLYQGEYALKNFNHPRYGNIEILSIGEQIWYNLNDLCLSAKATASSAIASLGKESEYLMYFQRPSDESYTPYVTEEGFLLAYTGRTPAYKRNIIKWATLEIEEPILPTINQMVILSPDPKPSTLEALNQHLETLKGKVRTFAQIHPQDNQPTDPAIFTPLQGNCTIDKLLALFKENGINLTKQKFTTWLSDNEYICHSRKFRNRPLIKYCKRGYFFDNRHIYITRYPLNALLFTPLGQLYFYDKIYTSINF